MNKLYYLGLDVGSTTVKLALLDKNNRMIYSKYQRHYSDIRKTIYELLDETCEMFIDDEMAITLTGSGEFQRLNGWMYLLNRRL